MKFLFYRSFEIFDFVGWQLSGFAEKDQGDAGIVKWGRLQSLSFKANFLKISATFVKVLLAKFVVRDN